MTRAAWRLFTALRSPPHLIEPAWKARKGERGTMDFIYDTPPEVGLPLPGTRILYCGDEEVVVGYKACTTFWRIVTVDASVPESDWFKPKFHNTYSADSFADKLNRGRVVVL